MNTPYAGSKRRLPPLAFVVLILLLTSLACNLGIVQNAPAAQADPARLTQESAIKATAVALDVRATLLAEQEQQLAQAATQSVPTQALPTAVPPTAVPPTAAPALPPTEIPPTQPPPPTESLPPTATPEPDYDEMIKNANILLYEDIAGYYNLTRWVRDALNDKGLKYTDVGDAVGNFKAEILSGKKWDLVIAAAEARKGFQGELFEYVADAANDDVAVIIETWYLDYMAAGPISRITGNCGIGYQKNWMNPDRDSRSIIWLDPDHPLFHYPNEGFSLVHYNPYWEGDAGDMMRVKDGGKGELVAGLYNSEKSRYGTLAVCYDGRVIIQTFSTHDYRKSDVTALWQNMVYYTLKNHFIKNAGKK